MPEINCPRCGAYIAYNEGEITADCPICGFRTNPRWNEVLK